MKVLFLSRKNTLGYGGLSRFTSDLYAHFPGKHTLLTLPQLYRLPALNISSYNIIHLSDSTLLPLGVALKYIYKKPLVTSCHGLDLLYSHPLYQMMLKTLLSHTDAAVTNSFATQALLRKFHLPKSKRFTINPGISLQYLQKPRPVPLPNPSRHILMLTVGNLVPRKGQAWFISQVMTHLPPKCLYIIVGRGPDDSKIDALITKLHLRHRVFLLDRITHNQLSYVFRKVHIYLAPNLITPHNYEGFGIAAGEAAALGLPVVASAIEGLPSVIHHGQNGSLIKPTPSNFIQAITQLKNSALRKKLGCKARLYTRRHFTWEKTANSYRQLFQSLTID